MSHAGSKSDSVFKILWKSGDKIWISFSEIADMNLLDPYLEAQGAESIADLGLGSGNLPCDDPQIFVACLRQTEADAYKEGASLLWSSSPSISEFFTTH